MCGAAERGQSTVEWVGLLLLVALLLAALVAAGVRVPGGVAGAGDRLADPLRGGARRLLRRRAGADRRLRDRGRRAGPRPHADPRLRGRLARRCRSTGAAAAAPPAATAARRAPVRRTDAGLPVTAFVHVVDCRAGAAETEAGGADCSGGRAGNLYIQYWLYYADSATLRGVPIAGGEGLPRGRLGVGPGADRRGRRGRRARLLPPRLQLPRRAPPTWASDAGIGPLRDARRDGRRPRRQRLGPGDRPAARLRRQPRRQPRRRSAAAATRPAAAVHLVPLEPIAAADSTTFAISPPWLQAGLARPRGRRTTDGTPARPDAGAWLSRACR